MNLILFRCLFLILTIFLVSRSIAEDFNLILDIGDQAPTWDKKPGVDGKNYAWNDFKSKEVVVIAFTCNSCPYAVDYEDRLIALAKKYQGEKSKVAIVAVNCNLVPEDSFEAMQERSSEKKFPFVYLFDETQEIGKKIGALKTPEFYVFNKKRELVYLGAMDDDTDPTKVKTNYVDEAITAALKGKLPKTTETIPVGCNIRYKRTRRK